MFWVNLADMIQRRALLICCVYFFAVSIVLCVKFTYFGYYDWDLSLYAHAMYSIIHGTTFSTMFGASFLADHAHLVAFLIAPLYFLFPHPMTLVFLEVFLFCVASFVLFRIAHERGYPYMGIFLMLLYMFHPANLFMLIYEFHFESIAIPLLFLIYYFYDRKALKSFYITALLLMVIKENMPLVVLMYGISGFFSNDRDKWKWGLLPAIVAVLYFNVVMFWMMPRLRADFPINGNMYWSMYSYLGKTPLHIIVNLLMHPLLLFQLMFSKENIIYLLNVAGGFVFGLSDVSLIRCLPLILQNFLSTTYTMKTIFYHYAASIVPFFAMGSLNVYDRLRRLNIKIIYQAMICIPAILFLISWLIFFVPFKERVLGFIDERDVIRQYITSLIPAKSGVVANFDFLSHLVNRQYLYPIYSIWKKVNPLTGKEVFLPDNVKYAIIDYRDPWLLGDISRDNETLSRIKKFIYAGRWKIYYQKEGIVLYKR